MKKLITALLVIVLVCISWQLYSFYNVPLPNTKDAVIAVRPGQGVRSVARELKEKNIISSMMMFRLWAKAFGYDRKLKMGEYPIPKQISLSELFEILVSGKSLGYRVIVPEGYNVYEVGHAIQRAGLGKSSDFVKLVHNKKFVKSLLGKDHRSLEGYLFPDTYYFTKSDSLKTMAKAMVAQFKKAYDQIDGYNGWSQHKVVTLASIIEKETGAPFERRKISSVFHNRLKKKMRLQTDPTVLSAKMIRTGKWSKNITKKDLLTKAPYNTYKISGLPPGPIANPGISAMKAAVDPDGSEFLFFVSRNDGTHVFSKTLKEHNAAVTKYQKNPRARRGKSWRDLKKRKKQ